MIPVSAEGISFNFVADGGFIRDFTVQEQGRAVSVLHTAPWVTSGETLSPETPVHLAQLAGDFFCAPFAGTSDGSPMHGWPANGLWQVQPGPTFRAVLDHTVNGATVVKELGLTDGHPFLYQRHIFVGGMGEVPAANHAMLTLPNGGLIRFSAKRWFETSPRPQETDPARGRSVFAYPVRTTDPRQLPLANGGYGDVTTYPVADRHEDFVVAVESPGHSLGWTAVTRPKEGDVYLSLRHAQKLPMTMFWHSNGGRDYAPWSGRHLSCLGVEEGAAVQMLGIGATETPDPLTAAGQSPRLKLDPNGVTEMRHAIGNIAWPSGEPVAEVTVSDGQATVRGEGGALRTIKVRDTFFV